MPPSPRCRPFFPPGPGLVAILAATGLAAGLAACTVSPNPAGDAAREPGSETPAPAVGEADPAPVAAPDGDLLAAELTTVGFDQLSGTPVVLLRELDSGQVLPIWIGLAEARAISLELHGVAVPRPMTHDLMASLLRSLDATLEEVVVHDLREGTYYGLLKLRVAGQEEPRWVDTRPSDGLALALRTDARILVARKLLEEQPDVDFLAPDSREQVVRALGLTVVAVDEVWREELGLPDRPGIVVLSTTGEAKRRGLRRGDLILELNGRVPREPVDLLDAISETPVGEPLVIRYWREGEEHTVELSPEVPELPTTEIIA